MLLRDQLTSFERLAVVLLLHKRAPGELSTDAIADQLQMRTELVDEALSGLAGGGLVEPAGTLPQAWRFSAVRPLSDAVNALSIAYCEQHAAIVSHMSLNAIERIRSGPQTPPTDIDDLSFERAPGDKTDS